MGVEYTFVSTFLNSADLRNANLTSASLLDANLTDADFLDRFSAVFSGIERQRASGLDFASQPPRP
jgi:uncharacterized protein YjbI with pentapeptide repeats